ncbi:DM13 domain-containing protein [Flavobacterium stagni]|uniref:DM13 domain-containing protein n=1 Tax=Flavobacterium stagni TaxID=2506421 RepID=A0A4Q1K8M6_9FLAO|nr:DM13 domain-containing protein [Flavobacterium stagni]RXR22006.1 hypothetical protein EQG61_11025 [Flavobacterium stagni]
MKKHSKTIVLFLSLLLMSCQEEGVLTQRRPVGADLTPNALLRYQANFTTTDFISGAGKVAIYLDEGRYKLKLVDYTIQEGPDLKVYLSQSDVPNNFINLGNLEPSQIYLIPENVSFSTYNYVLIHCQQYNHLFAHGQLIPQP